MKVSILDLCIHTFKWKAADVKIDPAVVKVAMKDILGTIEENGMECR